MALMGLMSRLWGGCSHNFSTPAGTFVSKYCTTILEVCFRSLSCLKMNSLLKQFPQGAALCCSICLYFSFVSIPLIFTGFPTPKAEIQPQTVTGEEEIGTILCAEHWCCLSSLLGYWAQSWTGRHSDTGYQHAGIHFSDHGRMTGRVNPTWY